MNINVIMYYLVVVLEWVITILPWALGLCGLLLIIWIVLEISYKCEEKRGRRR